MREVIIDAKRRSLLLNIGLLCAVLIVCTAARAVLADFFREDDYAGASFYELAASHILDTGRFDYIADARSIPLENGDTLEIAIPFDRPPAYPLLLALAKLAFGNFADGVAAVQFGLWLLIIVLAYLFAQRLFRSPVVAACAALFTGLYPYYVSNSLVVSDQSLTTVLFLGILLAALEVSKTHKLIYAILLGVLAGAEILTRGLSPFFIALFIVWLLLRSPQKMRAVFAVLAIVGSTAAIVGIWTLHTTAVSGEPVVVAGLGQRVWQANNAYIDACGYPQVTIDRCVLGFDPNALNAFTAAELETMTSLSQKELDRHFLQKGLATVFSSPLETLRRAAVKLYAAWSPLYNPTFDVHMNRVSTLKEVIYTASYVFLVAFAALGVYRTRRTAAGAIILIAFLFMAFSAYSAILWAHSGHKLFLMVYIILFAAYGFVWSLSKLQTRFLPRPS